MSTKTKTLQRNYAKLTDLERFRLVLAARERDDESEVRALANTAPKADYRMTAWPYRGMLDAIDRVGWLVLSEIKGEALLMFIGRGQDLARGIRRVIQAERDATNVEDFNHPWPDDFDPWDEAVRRAKNVLIAWEALGAFCEELEITREQVTAYTTAYFPPYLELILDFARGTVDLEEEFMAHVAERFCEREGDDLEEVLETRVANLASQQEESVREYADLLKQVWELEVKR